MADCGSLEMPDSFWDQFTDLSGLDNCPNIRHSDSKDGADLNKVNESSKPEASIIPSQSCSTGSADAQKGQSDGRQTGGCLTGFEPFSDLLKDELWDDFDNGFLLADLEKIQAGSDGATFSDVLGFNDPGDPVPTVDNVSCADIPAGIEAYQNPQLIISPASPVQLNLPVMPSCVAQNPTNWQSQGVAPTATMYHSPYASDQIATNQAVQQAPKAVAIPMPQGHKRKAVAFSDSVEVSTGMLATKRQKLHGRKAVLSRTEIIKTFDASKVYDPLPYHPQDWSIFKYTRDGELELGTLYAPAQILHYLYRHPLQALSDGTKALKKGRLRLWIQRNPSDSKRRYPDALQSNRCRFKDCFATHNVINQGHLRLCFDEFGHLNNDNFRTDPFKNAGYVHLNCLERFLDFPQICHDLPVMLDDRDMPLEPNGCNLMSLAPHFQNGSKMWEVASNFLFECYTETLIGYPRGARPHPGTFVWRVMLAKVGTPRLMDATNGSLVEVHLGDLELETAGRSLTQGRTGIRRSPAGRARRVVIDGDDEYNII